MRTYIPILFALFLGLTAQAQNKTLVASLTYNTPTNLLVGGKYTILEVLFQNAHATNSTIKFYDSATSSTNYVQAAYTAYSSYATNYSTTFTNTAGIIITNTWSGTYRSSSSVSASTNERPAVLGPFFIQASATTTVSDLAVSPNLGLTVYSGASGTLQITYRETNP